MIPELHRKGALQDIFQQQDQTNCPHHFYQPCIGSHAEFYSWCKDYWEICSIGVPVNQWVNHTVQSQEPWKTFMDASMSHQIGRGYAIKRDLEDKMHKVMEDIQIPKPSEDQIKDYLEMNLGEHLSMMYEPPFWIMNYAICLWELEGEEGKWMVQGKKRKAKGQSHLMGQTYYGLWKRGLNIAHIQPPQPCLVGVELPKKQKKKNVQPSVIEVLLTQQEQEQYQKQMFEFFSNLRWLGPSSSHWSQTIHSAPGIASCVGDEHRQTAAVSGTLGGGNVTDCIWQLSRRVWEVMRAVQGSMWKVWSCHWWSEDMIYSWLLPCWHSQQRRHCLLKDVDLIGCMTTGE